MSGEAGRRAWCRENAIALFYTLDDGRRSCDCSMTMPSGGEILDSPMYFGDTVTLCK